jgi:hypothetical protein
MLFWVLGFEKVFFVRKNTYLCYPINDTDSEGMGGEGPGLDTEMKKT